VSEWPVTCRVRRSSCLCVTNAIVRPARVGVVRVPHVRNVFYGAAVGHLTGESFMRLVK